MSTTLADWLNKRLAEKAAPSRRTIAEALAHYGCLCPPELTQLYHDFPGGFVELEPGESVLFFTPDQIVETVPALTDIDIADTGIVPLADFKDNNFLVYRPLKQSFAFYNGVDETEYGAAQDLENTLREFLEK